VQPDPQDLLRLNIPKADPALRLLAAHAGFEDGQIPFEEGWSIFKVFMRLPTSVEDGGATFQVAPADANSHVLEVFFGRELIGVRPPLADARVIGLSYVFHPPESGPAVRDYLVEGEEIWSTDFATLEDFFTAVEESEGYRTARGREVMMVTFYQQELEDGDLAPDGVDE
jgi:hypothetical protein